MTPADPPTRRYKSRMNLRDWSRPLPEWVYKLNVLIRASSDRLDELNRLMETNPSQSLARQIASQEKRLAEFQARHPYWLEDAP